MSLFARMGEDPAPPSEKPESKQRSGSVEGWLVCVEAVVYADRTIEPGTRVHRVNPTKAEIQGGAKFQGGLIEDAERDLDKREPREWIVIEYVGNRRRCPLRAFTDAPPPPDVEGWGEPPPRSRRPPARKDPAR